MDITSIHSIRAYRESVRLRPVSEESGFALEFLIEVFGALDVAQVEHDVLLFPEFQDNEQFGCHMEDDVVRSVVIVLEVPVVGQGTAGAGDHTAQVDIVPQLHILDVRVGNLVTD